MDENQLWQPRAMPRAEAGELCLEDDKWKQQNDGKQWKSRGKGFIESMVEMHKAATGLTRSKSRVLSFMGQPVSTRINPKNLKKYM